MFKKIFLLLLTGCLLQWASAFSPKPNLEQDPVAVADSISLNDSSIFEGKHLATFGNSITAAKNSWAYQLAKRLKFADLYNGAIGGAIWSKRIRTTSDGKKIVTQDYNSPGFAGISHKYTPNPDDLEYQKRINNCAIDHIQKYLLANPNPGPDYIILSYGTNDPSSAAELGDAAQALKEKNLTGLNVYTLAGSVKWCIESLRKAFPKAKLYVALPIQAASKKRNEDNQRKIAIIKKICAGMGVAYFDCFNGSGITQQNSKAYLRDGLHPNGPGNVLHANYIIEQLKEANKQ